MDSSKPLTNLQLELLKVFSMELSEEELLEVQQLLARHFAEKATDHIDAWLAENEWEKEKIESWAEEHMRYKAK